MLRFKFYLSLSTMRKILFLLLLILPFTALPKSKIPVDNTIFVQNIINTGASLPAGTYNVTHLTLSKSLNASGSIINCTATSGAMFTVTAANISLTNGTFNGGSSSSGSLSCVNATGAANLTISGNTVSSFAQYAVTATNTLNLHIQNNTISDIGYLGLSIITNSIVETGVIVSNNTINRSMQPAATVPQPAVIFRSFAPGIMTGAQFYSNTVMMPLNPKIDAAEGMEVRGCINSSIHNNTFTRGSIGLSIVQACTGTQAYSNTFTQQNLEAVELGDSRFSSIKTSTISGAKVGVLIDGVTGSLTDTLQNITISGSTSFPIEINVGTSTPLDLLIDHCTISTTNRAISLENCSGITINNTVASGNNATYAIFLVSSIGGVNINNSTFSGFTPKLIFATIPSGSITVNNIITVGAVPSTSFLGINTFGSITLGSNIHFNAGSAPVPLYTPNTYSLYKNSSVTITPTNSGSAGTWHISPVQPSGLNFSTTTGIIYGAPIALSPQTTYTITSTNTYGTGSTTVKLGVVDNPPSISYSPNAQVAVKGVAISQMTPVNTGGDVTSATISPSLPAGLSISSTGVISGTATVTSPTTTYSVQAFNTGGSSTAPVTITVNPPAPAAPNISYSPNSYVFPINVPIAPFASVNVGGLVDSYSISPSLPTGLSFNTSTSEITGTPTVNSSTTVYDVSGTNMTGSSHTSLTLSVVTVLPAPPSITYNPSSLSLQINQPSPILVPINSGGTATGWSVSPDLPTGLVLNSTSGQVSGTPTVLSPLATYIVTATNTGGSGSFPVSIAVLNPSPGKVIRVNLKAIVVP